MYKVKVPAIIGGKDIFISTDVVDSEIPMLLSRESMKKANTKINFKDDSVNMFGVKQKIIVTTSGHYAVPLNDGRNILEELDNSNVNITLHSEAMGQDKKKMALKLHCQFSHPAPKRLLQLVRSAGLGNDSDLIHEINEVSKNCKICLEYKRPSPRPVVGLPLATRFNQMVAMDLKMINGKWVLHLIDHVSRFSAASFIPSKNPEQIIKVICRIWISVFGPPGNFLCDNGGEFNNEGFRNMCEKFNISLKTTAAESPWSNGLCERHNAVLNEVFLKTIEETKSQPGVALCWAVHAKNSLANVHGFSPYQIAIGYTPQLPGVLNNTLPALEDGNVSQFLADNLCNMSAARKAFIQSESSERIRRALRHNIRPSSMNKFFTGDTVYYKRNDSKKWKGPGKVIGYDSQQILIKHGSVYVRVHPCRAMLDREDHQQDSQLSEEPRIVIQNEIEDKGDHSFSADNYSSDEEHDPLEFPVIPAVDIEENNHPVSQNRSNIDLPPSSNEETEENVERSNPFACRAVSDSMRNRPSIKKGMLIEYADDDKWVSAEIVSRAGKASGKYKSHWNVRDNENKLCELDFDQISDWRIKYPEDSVAETCVSYNLSQIFVSEMNTEVDDAKKKELQNWIDEKVYEEVKDVGQKAISVRWVVTPKLIDGKWSTKARLVARGFEEDSSCFRTDSPTCMKESLRVMLTIAASNNWKIQSVDIKAAFLQGKCIEREVFLRPPKEVGINGILWLLKKAVYGLSDASRIWYLRVVEELNKLGVLISKYDKAFFFWKQNGQLQGTIIVHVDDFLWAGTPKFLNTVVGPFKNCFRISKQSDSIFKYIGLEIEQNQFGISISQNTYINSVDPVPIPSAENQSRHLSNEERRAFRGIVGQLIWSSSMTRPDISFDCCELSTMQSNPKLIDLKRANKVLLDMKREKIKINFHPIDLNSAKLIVFSDASYANLPDGASQGGHMIFLSDNDGNCAPISWCSKRIRRIARSTISAETQSAVEALDTAYMLERIISELFNFKKRMDIVLFIDSKSLFDAINTTNLLIDKRLRVDVSALREMNENNEVEFRWIEGKKQIADVLTKRGPSKSNLLRVLEECILP